MTEKNLKYKAISGLFWKFLERCGSQGVSFVISMIIARLLLPEDYGVIALLTVFINISTVFIQSGISTALIQNKDVDDDDFSSILYISMGIAVLAYAILFFAAPFIASYYNMSELAGILRVLALVLIPGALNSVQNAYVTRKMDFKVLFYRSLGAGISSGFIGIVMAYTGFGVWALVGQQLSNAVIICVILWFTVKWRPKLVLKLKRVKVLYSYGWKLLVSSLLNTAYNEVRTLVIGKKYTSATLGFYNKGVQFPSLVTNNLDSSIQAVMLPTLSKVQDDKNTAKSIMRRSITMSSFFVFPMMAGLAVCAEPLIKLILTEKWLGCVPFLQIACLTFALNPIHTANLQAINAMGRSDVFLKLEIIKKVLAFLILIITVQIDVYAIAWGGVIASIISTLINSFPNKKILNYGYFEQIKDLFPNFLISVLMAVVVYFIGFIKINTLLLLITQVLIGAIIYVLLALVFKNSSFLYLINTLKSKRGSRK